MRFDSASSVEEVVWDMRLSEQVRAEDRATLLRIYDGFPPFNDDEAKLNNIQVNVNDLSGVNLLSMARRQWNNAFLKPSNFFSARPDFGPGHKRTEWANTATRHANRLLKRERRMIGQIRATGANTILFGIGPTNWKDRRSVIPTPIPVGSLMIPSETEIDEFDNLPYFAVFREWTAAQLWDMTHGPKTDPGWNMDLVKQQWDYIKEELRKSPNSLAYQYMPERIEQLMKQDKGYMGTDAVPTCDVWDFYFREEEDGKGWYRRILLDWNVGSDVGKYKGKDRPTSRNKVGDNTDFLYSSRDRKYSNSISEILHCQFGDCSPYAPFKYHSIRSLGWMLWGVCDLQNRLHCKFNEGVFEQLMWFFQTAGNQDLIRIKKANFEHMGVIPQGIKFLTAQERFTPNAQLIQMAFARNRQLMGDSATTYTQNYDEGSDQKARTATETMAIVNASQALASGILEMAYTYEAFKDREMFRRMCLKNSPDPIAREFRRACLADDIPPDMIDADRWTIEPEQVLGGGNKTVQMATVGFLNQIRKNLPPNGQRLVDHISVESATDQPGLAEEMAPIGEDQPISNSTKNAQDATMRIMHGFPYAAPKDAVLEDYITVWLHDLGLEVEKAMKAGGMTTPEQLSGMTNLGKIIGSYIQELETHLTGEGAAPEDKEKIDEFKNLFSQLTNHIKAFAQRLQQAMKAQQPKPGANGGDGKREAALIMAKTKAQIAENSAIARTAQKQQQWEMQQKRDDQRTAAEIQREGVRTRHQLLADRMKALSE